MNGRIDGPLRTPAVIVFAVGVVVALSHAAIPLEQFIHRGDDAYYYFKVALNHVATGRWTFDGIHPTSGVQPLWALLLTGTAHALHWIGLDAPVPAARAFVALSALLHVAGCFLLYVLLARTVSAGVAIAAAGASLFSIGLVWARVWGMENSLYALLLVATVAWFHLVHMPHPGWRTAVVLGLLLGMTALARLNAGLLIPCLLLWWLWRGSARPFAARWWLGVTSGLAALAVLVPYFAWNYATHGYLMPVSGAVKAIGTAQFLEASGIETRFSVDFLKHLYWRSIDEVQWFVTSRVVDGLWIVGGRVLFRPDSGTTFGVLAAVLGGLLVLPAMLGRPRQWIGVLGDRITRLAQFGYFAAFAVLNAAVSVFLYPLQINYAIVRWWLVESEILLLVLAAAIAVSTAAHFGGRLVPSRHQALAVMAGVLALVAFHTQESLRYFFAGTYVATDWNRSWNDESHAAARWLAVNVPADARVGSWNAGVLGYHAVQRVTNLDGLINDYELLPYLEQRRISDYIREQELDYLSDMDGMFMRLGIADKLVLTEVYSRYSGHMHQYYRIYRLDD